MGAIGIPIALGIFSFAPVFMFCEVGEQLNSRSIQINDAIRQLDWDTFPHQVQQMMPIILLTALIEIGVIILMSHSMLHLKKI